MTNPESLSSDVPPAPREPGGIPGRRLVVPFVVVTAVTLAVFLTVQLGDRGAAKRNYLALSYTAALRDLDDGYYLDAVKNLTPLIEAGANPAAYGWRGEAYLRMEKYAEAEADLREAVRLEPDLPANHAGLGDAVAGQGRLEEALTHLDRAEELLRRPDAPRPGEVRRWGDVLTDVLFRRYRLLQSLDRRDEAARVRAEIDRRLGKDASDDPDRPTEG